MWEKPQLFVWSCPKWLYRKPEFFFKCAPHDDYCLILACFIYPSWCENCHGPPHALLWNPLNTHSHIASTGERAASIIEQLFKMKEAFSTEVKCGFDRQKPFPICSAILIWSHDNILYIIDKLQNICLPSHAQPDLFHKEKCGSLHSLSLIWEMHWKQMIELTCNCFSVSKWEEKLTAENLPWHRLWHNEMK